MRSHPTPKTQSEADAHTRAYWFRGIINLPYSSNAGLDASNTTGIIAVYVIVNVSYSMSRFFTVQSNCLPFFLPFFFDDTTVVQPSSSS